MKGYLPIRFLNIFGVPVWIHWWALVVMGLLFVISLREPLLGIITICSYFGLILLHEAGHAYVARRLGYHPREIYLGLFHGYCVIDAPDNLRDECIIAWGGVLAQLVVAIPLIVLNQATPLAQLSFTGPIVVFLGFISLIVALFNLMPIRNLDGNKAWQLISIEINHFRNKAKAKRLTQDIVRRLKKRS